jgi:hypothetical protein
MIRSLPSAGRLASTGDDGESPMPTAVPSSNYPITLKEIQGLVGILALLVSFTNGSCRKSTSVRSVFPDARNALLPSM